MIKFLLRTVFIIVLLFLCLFAGLHIFVRLKGREMVARKMAAAFQSGVTVKSVSTGVPLTLVLSDVEVAGWFTARKIVAGLGLVDLFSDDFILTSLRLHGLKMALEKKPPPQSPAAAPEPGPAPEAPAPQQVPEVSQPVPQARPAFPFPGRIVVKRFVISDGAFDLIDYSRQDQPITIALRNVEVSVENIRWPLESSFVSFFTVTARLPFTTGAEEGRVAFEGWINPVRKDMRATLDVRGIDGVALYPYYRDWVAFDQARIARARLNFSSDITSLNNDVNAACHLELTQIEFKPREGDGAEHRIEKMINAVIGLFKAMDQGKIVLDFTFKTKLDNPEFGLLGVIESALKTKVQAMRKSEASAEQIINFPGKVLKSTVTGTADLTKALINGTVSVGKELKKAVEGSFTRDSDDAHTPAEDTTVPPITATK